MCGIAGLFYADARPIDPARVEAMNDALAHRGPDGAGVWTAPGVALGHRRLSVIDLAGSRQPMVAPDEQAVLSFNGEIYNFRELRRELETRGARFVTDGDTETILAAWRAWGPGCLERLDGMFAFALWDVGRRTLFLARDRFGVKPLYTARLNDGGFAFASELKALLRLPELARELDPLAIEDYLTWGYMPDRRAILRGVDKLPAGHCRMLRPGEAPAPPRRWFDLDFEDRAQGDRDSLGEELHDRLDRAVRSRMVADVPLGAFLSGGVDSSTVVALMSGASARPVTTCAIGFAERDADESGYARRVAEQFGTDHHQRIVDPGDTNAIDALAGVFDEPFADASALPTFLLCRMAREHVTVALSGDGADEALAGYRRQVFHHHEERARGLLPSALRAPVFGALGALWPKADWAPRPLRAKATLRSLARSGEEGYAAALAVTPPHLRARLASPDFAREIAGYRAEDTVIELMRGAPARTGLDRAQYADLMFWLPGDILTKVDRASMAVGLEMREPLLDHRLVRFAARLPDAMRVRGRQGKWLMKRAMERELPHDILYRPKQGFVLPIAQWFRGPLRERALSIAGGSALARTGWFDAAAIDGFAQAHLSGRSDHSRLLWQLLMLEASLERLGV